jgi:hypothetical protein
VACSRATGCDGRNGGADSDNVTVTEYLSVNAVAKHAEVYAVPSTQRTDTFRIR